MKKNTMFKRFASVVLIVMFAFLTTVKLEAADKLTSITKNVSLVGDAVTSSLWEGVDVERMHVKSERVGSYSSTDAGLVYDWDAVSVIAESNPAIKIASWGITTNVKEGYKQGTTTAIAEDYEKNHPGYTVLAAINGDFFGNTSFTTSQGKTIQPTFEPINTWVADGGLTFKKPTLANQHHHVIGFRLDRTYTYHIGSSYASDGTPIQDNQTVTGHGENIPEFTDTLIATIGDAKVPAYVTSSTLSETGVNVILPGNHDIDTTGYSVIRFNIDRMSRANDGFQGKYFIGLNFPGHSYNIDYTGLYLTGRSFDASAQSVDKITTVENCFYVVTKEDAVKNAVSSKERITIQYELTGSWGDVNSTIGTVIPFLVEGTRTQFVSNSNNYLNDQKPKSVIAFTKDNDAIFFFMGPGPLSGAKDKGPSSIEMAELLERLGAVNAFCLDGGGSATIVVKNAQGGFTELNSPTDAGGTRSIGNALLMIVEDSNLELKETFGTKAVFHQSKAMADSTLTSATLHINGKSYELENGEIEVTGLKKSTEYTYYFDYTYENNGVSYSTRTNDATFTTLDTDVVVPTHEHVECPTCGLCTSSDCDGIDAVKCQGHDEKPNHEHVECPECGLCTSNECDGIDRDKCQGHDEEPKHEHVECPTCGLCTSSDCDGTDVDKCPGHKTDGGNTGGGMNCNFGAYVLSMVASLGLVLLVFKKRR